MAEREIITRYFHLGYPNEVIREFLSNYHDIVMSLRTLKRRLSDFGLRRNMIDHENIERRIREAIENEISNDQVHLWATGQCGIYLDCNTIFTYRVESSHGYFKR